MTYPFAATLRVATLLLSVLAPLSAHAAGKCSPWTGGGYPLTRNLMLQNTSLVMPRDRYDPSNEVTGLFSRNVVRSGEFNTIYTGSTPIDYVGGGWVHVYAYCDSPLGSWTRELKIDGLGPPIPGTYPPVYHSGVAGVGIRARLGLGNWAPFSHPEVTAAMTSTTHGLFWSVEVYTAEIVAMPGLPRDGAPELGMTKQATLTVDIKQGGAAPDFRVLNLILPPIQILRGSCTLENKTVNLGRVPLSEFDNSDAPARGAKPFELRFTCDYNSTRLRYKVESNQVYDRNNGTLSLDDTPISARNVGLQIQGQDGVPIVLGGWRDGYANPEQTTWPGLNTIPLIAQYRRLQPGPISPGLANATATVTMQYY